MIKPAENDVIIGAETEEDCLRHRKLKSLATAFFQPGGPLTGIDGGRGYEYRPQQVEMAEAVATVLSRNHNLCVEAPTGVGKSFAYLVPAIHYAAGESRPVVISTETINLQEQLMEKDIPLLRRLSGVEFTAALAKGRGNYVCQRRLQMATGERQAEFFPQTASLAEARRIMRFLENPSDGSRASLPFNVDPATWQNICCEGGNCRGPKCSFLRHCYYWTARRSWDKADIIVANHALFFADLKMKIAGEIENTLLPPYAALIVDEAHTMEDNAAEHLGMRITRNGFHHYLRRLFNPKSGSGLLLKSGREAMKLREIVMETEELAGAFFGMIDERMERHDDDILRVTRPMIVPDLLSDKLGVMKKELEEYIKLQEDDDFKTELGNLLSQCNGYMEGIFQFMNMTLSDHVYWIEQSRGGENRNTTLQAAPLNVSVMLYQTLFSKNFPVILTSATLTVGQTMDYYRSRVGYGDGSELVLDSPFNPAQVRLHVARRIPDPAETGFAEALPEQIKKYVALTHGKAFVLFTSYQVLRSCAESLRNYFLEEDITLLVQGEEFSRTAMLKRFRDDINSVIFGTTSFWTGVDVPGEALSNVIITKLPFPVPSHPLIEARNEKIRELGGNPFMHYSLPEAILKLRQGIGRLIRSAADTGIVVLLDKRVLTKRYGSLILDSLPPYPMQTD